MVQIIKVSVNTPNAGFNSRLTGWETCCSCQCSVLGPIPASHALNRTCCDPFVLPLPKIAAYRLSSRQKAFEGMVSGIMAALLNSTIFPTPIFVSNAMQKHWYEQLFTLAKVEYLRHTTTGTVRIAPIQSMIDKSVSLKLRGAVLLL